MKKQPKSVGALRRGSGAEARREGATGPRLPPAGFLGAPSKWLQAGLPLSVWQMGSDSRFTPGNSKSPNRLPTP